ncbi:MAG: winged helix-turn-helix domain-containing protein [Candidatus Thorarchaeota archaeon]
MAESNDHETEQHVEIDELVLKALNHNIRRRILFELYEKGWAGYTELTHWLKLTSGVFYHHMRILVEAGLINQSVRDKTYEITPNGARAAEFFRSSLPATQPNPLLSWVKIYSPVSTVVTRFPFFSLLIQLLLIVGGLVMLTISHQFGIAGFFLFSIDDSLILIMYSIFSTFTGIIALFLFWVFDGYAKHVDKKRGEFASHVLIPQTIITTVFVVISLLPPIPALLEVIPAIGLPLSIIFQLFGLSYYIHVFQKNGSRSFAKLAMAVMIQQYFFLASIYFL